MGVSGFKAVFGNLNKRHLKREKPKREITTKLYKMLKINFLLSKGTTSILLNSENK